MATSDNMTLDDESTIVDTEFKCLAFYGEQDIYDIEPRIKAAFENDRPVIVAGETGQGKTTALIKLCISFASGTKFGILRPIGIVPMIYMSGEQTKDKLNRSNSYIGFAKEKAKVELTKKKYQNLKKAFEYFGEDDLPEDRSIDNILKFITTSANEIRNRCGWKKEDRTVGVVVDNVENVFSITITSQPIMQNFWERIRKWQRRENVTLIGVMSLKENGKKKNQKIKVQAIAGASKNRTYCGEAFAVDERRFYGIKNHNELDIGLDSKDCRFFLNTGDEDSCLFDDVNIRQIKNMKAGDLDVLICRLFGKQTPKQLRTIKQMLIEAKVIRRDADTETGKQTYRYSGCDSNVQPIIEEEEV